MFSPPPSSSLSEPCSLPSVAHHSFDMAQQVHYPSDPLQPGPIYFLTPQKCGIFWVCCEAIPRQINYLTDEANDTGKGPTALSACYTICLRSMAWERHWCTCMLTTVSARIRIILSYLVDDGWAPSANRLRKFSPDWCFGLLKQRFRRTRVGCLADLEQVVNISAEANIAQLVGTQSGEVVIQTYNWTSMFAGRLRKLKHIKKYHHLVLQHQALCVVKLESDSAEERISLFIDHTWAPTPDNLPPVVVPSGLFLDRQWYLYNQIAQHYPDNVHDVVCPRPLTPLSCAISTTASTSTATAASASTATAASASTATAASVFTATAASTSTAKQETVLLTPAGSSHWSTATAEHHQPPAKWARVCSRHNTSSGK